MNMYELNIYKKETWALLVCVWVCVKRHNKSNMSVFQRDALAEISLLHHLSCQPGKTYLAKTHCVFVCVCVWVGGCARAITGNQGNRPGGGVPLQQQHFLTPMQLFCPIPPLRDIIFKRCLVKRPHRSVYSFYKPK